MNDEDEDSEVEDSDDEDVSWEEVAVSDVTPPCGHVAEEKMADTPSFATQSSVTEREKPSVSSTFVPPSFGFETSITGRETSSSFSSFGKPSISEDAEDTSFEDLFGPSPPSSPNITNSPTASQAGEDVYCLPDDGPSAPRSHEASEDKDDADPSFGVTFGPSTLRSPNLTSPPTAGQVDEDMDCSFEGGPSAPRPPEENEDDEMQDYFYQDVFIPSPAESVAVSASAGMNHSMGDTTNVPDQGIVDLRSVATSLSAGSPKEEMEAKTKAPIEFAGSQFTFGMPTGGRTQASLNIVTNAERHAEQKINEDAVSKTMRKAETRDRMAAEARAIDEARRAETRDRMAAEARAIDEARRAEARDRMAAEARAIDEARKAEARDRMAAEARAIDEARKAEARDRMAAKARAIDEARKAEARDRMAAEARAIDEARKAHGQREETPPPINGPVSKKMRHVDSRGRIATEARSTKEESCKVDQAGSPERSNFGAPSSFPAPWSAQRAQPEQRKKRKADEMPSKLEGQRKIQSLHISNPAGTYPGAFPQWPEQVTPRRGQVRAAWRQGAWRQGAWALAVDLAFVAFWTAAVAMACKSVITDIRSAMEQ
jgi:hypothetical protein